MIYHHCNDNGRTVLVVRQDEARKIDPKFESIDVPTDKAGLMGHLQGLHDRIYELEQQLATTAPPDPTDVEPEQPQNLHWNAMAFDDAWDTFPLARKAHFASLFCEEARLMLKPSSQASMSGAD